MLVIRKGYIMAKGYKGQSCAQAIRDCFKYQEGPLSYSQILNQVKTKGAWKEITIWRYLMATVVNLIPARFEWKNVDKFLSLRPDGRYELFNKSKHSDVIE
jgi:hypothetical protein